MSIWWKEFHDYLIDAFIDPNVLFGNFIYYTIIGLLLAFSFGNDTDDSKETEDYFKLFKYVSFAQSAFGLINNSSRLNEPRKYLIKISKSEKGLHLPDLLRNVFLVTITSGLFRVFITFWYSLMVYPIAGLRGGFERFLVYWLVLYCQTMATFCLATTISASSSNHRTQIRNACTAFIITILFSGGYYLESSVTWILRWIEYLSTSYYGRAALANNEYDGASVNDGLSGNEVLDSKHAHGLGLWGSVGALMGLFVLYYCTTNIFFVFNLRTYICTYDRQMAPMWPLLLSVFIGLCSVGIFILRRKWTSHFILKEFKIWSFKKLRFASFSEDLHEKIDSQNLTQIKGSLIIEITGFQFNITSSFKFIFYIESVKIYMNSNLLKMTSMKSKKSGNVKKTRNSTFLVLKHFFKALELRCQNISLLSAVGEYSRNQSDTLIVEHFNVENLCICKSPLEVFHVDSITIEQFIIGINSKETELILKTGPIQVNHDESLTQFDVLFTRAFLLNLNVRFLYFISSFIKVTTAPTSDSSPRTPGAANSESLSLPWPILLNIIVPGIDFKLILPETDPSVKYFKWLQFKFTKLVAKCFLSNKTLPKLTALIDKFEIITKLEERQKIGPKHFCPVDNFLRRGPEQVADRSKSLIVSENISVCNWTSSNSFQRTTLPETFINDWIDSILKGVPLCSIQTEMVDLSSMDLDMTNFESLHSNFENYTYAYFNDADLKSDRTIFGVLDQFDFYIPFEFPISSLIDHSVVLFKAGWRPLSKKTDRGYWIGDGDKFLRTDWALNLQAKRARAHIEDDAFESKISAISHFQRKLAESRCRLEPAILSESSIGTFTEDSKAMQKLANILAVSTDKVEPGQSVALIELYKSLFTEYRGLISKSHLLTNWSLVDLVVDNLKVCLSWSPRYLGTRGSLASLLNRIENGSQIDSNTIESLSTFLGGFIDISGTAVQINLRNYSRPVLIAPDLRITGPVFLVEDGVKDPDVLIKFPVRVLPHNCRSNFTELPTDGTVDVLRSILPIKMYHCVYASINRPELVQISVSPYWLGCLALLDRVIDRFVKASIEDPSPPLPGWDKLRYNVRGCHSRLTIASPCIISRITDSDPLSCTEVLNLSFPHGVDIGIIPGGIFVLKCQRSTLSVDSQYLYNIRCALETSGPLRSWDLGIGLNEPSSPKSMRSLSESSLDLSQNALIPIIKLSKTHLELKFCIKNIFNDDPCHHWTVRPIARSNCSRETDWEHHDTFRYFRSKSIALELSGFVGADDSEFPGDSSDDIRFLYYREFERWISRYMAAPSSDIDVVKRGPLHQSTAIPELQQRTSFASVFTEFHLSVDFSDLFICRLMNFSSLTESQALWSASRRSLLNMDWRRGIVDQHGREDWVYYYGELEFLNVHFVVTSHSPSSATISEFENDFPVHIPGVKFNDLLRAPRLFYLSLDENCFKYDPDSLNVQCQTVLKRRQALLSSLAEVTKQLGITPSMDTERLNQISIAMEALKKRQKYYDSFLYKAQNNSFSRDTITDIPNDLEFADTSHFEIYNAQLVWGLFNRDIVFKFIDELFVLQKKKFSQNRNGLVLMRKMAQTVPQTNQLPIISESPSNRTRSSFLLSPTETIDSFFESLLERKSLPNSPFIQESEPFTASAKPETEKHNQERNDIRKGFDFRSPINFRDSETISVPRVVDVSFFNPQLCFMTPTHVPAGAILITAREAKVEFSPIFDKHLVESQEREFSLNEPSSLPALDGKLGTRTRISLEKASWHSGSKSNFRSWPRSFLQACYAQELSGLQRLSAETEVVMVYDVSNVAYPWTPSSPRIKIFGHGDTIKFSSNGLSMTTTSENFRQVLDVIVNLLVYRDPNQEARSEKLETLLIAANLSDRRTFAAKMQEFRSRLDTLRCQLIGRRDFELSFLQVQNLLELYDRTERELALIGEAMRMIQASRDELNQKRTRLSLNVIIDRIQWTLLVSKLNEPSFDLQPACNISLQDITNQWISKEDGSMENTFEIGSAFFINQLPVPFYRNVLRPFDVHHGQDGVQLRATVDYGCLLRFFAKSRLPVNGIVVLDHVEVDISPLQLQLTFDIATQIYKFFLPEKIKKRTSTTSESEDKGFLSRTLSARPRTRTEISDLILSDQDGPFDEVLEMKQRSEQNVFFVYVKVPPSQHLVSYKGSGKSSLLDIDRFILSLPEMEYNNRLWSWPEFFNQIRKDTILVLLKNAGSLFKDKIKKLGQKNLPERPDSSHLDGQDELYFRNLARKANIDVLDDETPDEREKKNFLVFGKSLFKLMKK